MADYTQTVNESIRTFGPGPSTKWGTAPNDVYVMTWGVDKWGEGSEDLNQVVTKLIEESQSSSDTNTTLVMTKLLSETLPSLSEEIVHAYLTLGGYSHVFIPGVTDAEDQTTTTYAKATNPSTSFTISSNPSTTWT